MPEHSIELGVGDVVRIGETTVRVRAIEGDEVVFEIVDDSGREPDVIDGNPPRRPR